MLPHFDHDGIEFGQGLRTYDRLVWQFLGWFIPGPPLRYPIARHVQLLTDFFAL